ncbi:MAG: carbohydrate binding family 9 domain-containing protein, partial [Gemmatimonadales bacterium]|nr:carbohydrate binding family 9 domain-containing protein [Gemmatimonadales bacterium]
MLSRPSILPCLLFLTMLGAASVAAQGIAPASITAHRVTAPPVLDGVDDEASWRGVPSTDQFREVRPREDGAPLQRTAFRVGYDAQYLYVFVRLYDVRPDSIVGRLSRRDDQSVSDHVTVMIDSYHDKRTGFEFQVNPVGVKADYAIYNDGEEDSAWDAVWDVATKVDSLGWTAEYRIP